MPALAKRLPSRMTVAEFVAWPGEGSHARFELVYGEPRNGAGQRFARRHPG